MNDAPITLPPGVAWFEDPRPGLAVDIDAASARILIQGAHLLEWTPRGADPVIWLSEISPFEPGVEALGGVPICFPWFGYGRQLEHELVHGWARLVDWTLVSATVVDERCELVFALDSGAYLDRPGAQELAAASVEYRVSIGAELRLDLSVTAGPVPLDVEAALHTYLELDSVETAQVVGLDQVTYWSKVDNSTGRQEGPVTFPDGIDRVYDGAGPVDGSGTAALEVVTDQRTIQIATQGVTKSVLWNPSEQGRALLGSRIDQFVCVESACVRDQAIVLAPGQQHVMSVTYRVTPGGR